MGLLKGLGWCCLFIAAAIIGNSPILLDHIPVPLLVVMFMSPWIYIATLAARSK